MDAKGYMVDVKGYKVDAKGYTVDVKDVRGSRILRYIISCCIYNHG